jgi:RND superfamily putative drug exporter
MFTLHVKLAAACYRHAAAVLFVWAALLVLAGRGALALPELVKGHGLVVEDGSYEEAQRLLASDFGLPDEPVIVLFEQDGHARQSEFQRYIDGTLDRLRGVDGLLGVISPQADPSMRRDDVAYAVLQFRQPPYALQPAVAELRRRLPAAGHMKAMLTGKAVVQADVNAASRRDLQRAELIGLPIAFVILRLAFGGSAAALLPIAVGASATAGAMGIAAACADRIGWSVFVLNVMPMVGLALGLDFALVLVSRFREELRRRPGGQALVVTMRLTGGAVAVSAVCVLLGLAGIMALRLPIFTTVALAAMLTVALALLLSFTLLPALLAVAAPWLRPLPLQPAESSGAWERWAAAVMRRPLLSAALAVCVLAGCMPPLIGLRLAVPDASSLPRSYASRQAAEAFAARFEPQSASRIYVIAEAQGPAFASADAAAVSALAARLKADPLVLAVESAATAAGLAPDRLASLLQRADAARRQAPLLGRFIRGNRTLLVVTLRTPPHAQQARDWVRRLERSPFPAAGMPELRPHAVFGDRTRAADRSVPDRPAAPLRIVIGGEPKYEQELFDVMKDRLPYAAGFIFAAITAVLLFAFRSVVIPVKTALMHALALGAAFGLLAAVCRQGHFGFEPADMAFMIPVFVFGLVFGISMDYGVFLLARIAEEYRRCGDNDAAVRRGMAATSRLITSAAAIVVAVTLPFAAADVAGVRQLGIGIAAAVALDATVVRLLLVPSLMKLLGRANWWWPFRSGPGA